MDECSESLTKSRHSLYHTDTQNYSQVAPFVLLNYWSTVEVFFTSHVALQISTTYG